MVVAIFDYTLEELLLFLKNLDESQIKESRHFIESNITRNDDIGMIYDLLLNKKPVIEVDSIFIKITENYKYQESLELEDGIILDFSEEGIPVALEILDISNLFSVKKDCFNNIENINITIAITNSSISLNLLMELLINNEKIDQPFSTVAKNIINVPEMEVICYC